ncbi:hypothetical protein TNCV_3737271 [Trichonephila clavipes]|nr:hypothetical protein TNCV_3737271 [Trichonephila clavipes]
MNKIRKTSAGFDCSIVLSEEFIAIYDDNACTAPIRAKKNILKFVLSLKNIIDEDYNGGNVMNIVPVSTSSEMRNAMKSLRSYLDTHSNGEIND